MSSWQAGEVTLTSIDHGGHEDDTSVMTAKQAGKDILFGSVRPLYSPDVDLAHPTVFYHGAIVCRNGGRSLRISI